MNVFLSLFSLFFCLYRFCCSNHALIAARGKALLNSTLLERLLDSKRQWQFFYWQECSESVYLMHWVVSFWIPSEGTAWSVFSIALTLWKSRKVLDVVTSQYDNIIRWRTVVSLMWRFSWSEMCQTIECWGLKIIFGSVLHMQSIKTVTAMTTPRTVIALNFFNTSWLLCFGNQARDKKRRTRNLKSWPKHWSNGQCLRSHVCCRWMRTRSSRLSHTTTRYREM